MTKQQSLLILLATMTTLSFSQATRNIEVVDASAAGSPIALKGHISFDPTRALLSVTGHNRSRQGLLALLAEVNAKPFIFYREQHDHFFKEIEITAHSDFIIGGGPIEFPFGNSSEARGVANETTHAEAKVLWVQFEDGSTWGDKQSEATVFAARAEIKEFLGHLMTVQKESGDDAFVRELSAPQPSGSAVEAMAAGFRQLQQFHGTAALVDHINKRLIIGNARLTKK